MPWQSGGEADDLVDSDGEVLGFENLVHAIFEIVHVLMEVPRLALHVFLPLYPTNTHGAYKF